ncbi:hypothetical protein Pme01_47890 [Planosporangium mesophilum]|uniref:HAMP domain-containing protein n=2 Tax=Planosporangium mesophilum TaxID=689768 RepID=A0A8J3X269_9ACTN|nr:hypothetical protein Pme01_47890 [Planosporangium mesophilum]
MAGDTDQALGVLVQQAKPLFIKWLAAINVFIDLEESMNQAESAKARGLAGGFLLIMVLMCALAIVIAVVVAWWITRGITRPLAEAVTVLSAVAGGDLTRRLNITSHDEVGQLGRSLNTALTTVGEVMTGFAHSADGVTSASERISGLSDRIASGAEESSARADVVADTAGGVSRNVQGVAAASEQMGSSIREIARNANEAAVAGRAMARHGNDHRHGGATGRSRSPRRSKPPTNSSRYRVSSSPWWAGSGSEAVALTPPASRPEGSRPEGSRPEGSAPPGGRVSAAGSGSSPRRGSWRRHGAVRGRRR